MPRRWTDGRTWGKLFSSQAHGAPVAQLDRASGYEPEGREFESPRAHHSPAFSHGKTRAIDTSRGQPPSKTRNLPEISNRSGSPAASGSHEVQKAVGQFANSPFLPVLHRFPGNWLASDANRDRSRQNEVGCRLLIHASGGYQRDLRKRSF